MPTVLYVGIVIVVWVGCGLAAAAFLHRRGHRDPLWYLLGSLLGVLFVPIAAERARRSTRRIAGSESAAMDGPGEHRMTVVVGVDRSPESQRMVDEVQRFLAAAQPEIVLVHVIDRDEAEVGGPEPVTEDRQWLLRYADQVAGRLPRPATEVVTGPPAKALLDLADARGADLIAVGRRGEGLSARLLGSVADRVARESSRPVLLGRAGRGRD